MKGLQQVIDSQGTKIASLLTEREMTALGHADESTGQGTSCDCHVIQPLYCVQLLVAMVIRKKMVYRLLFKDTWNR